MEAGGESLNYKRGLETYAPSESKHTVVLYAHTCYNVERTEN